MTSSIKGMLSFRQRLQPRVKNEQLLAIRTDLADARAQRHALCREQVEHLRCVLVRRERGTAAGGLDEVPALHATGTRGDLLRQTAFRA
jgi:hypothetical protein